MNRVKVTFPKIGVEGRTRYFHIEPLAALYAGHKVAKLWEDGELEDDVEFEVGRHAEYALEDIDHREFIAFLEQMDYFHEMIRYRVQELDSKHYGYDIITEREDYGWEGFFKVEIEQEPEEGWNKS